MVPFSSNLGCTPGGKSAVFWVIPPCSSDKHKEVGMWLSIEFIWLRMQSTDDGNETYESRKDATLRVNATVLPSRKELCIKAVAVNNQISRNVRLQCDSLYFYRYILTFGKKPVVSISYPELGGSRFHRNSDTYLRNIPYDIICMAITTRTAVLTRSLVRYR